MIERSTPRLYSITGDSIHFDGVTNRSRADQLAWALLWGMGEGDRETAAAAVGPRADFNSGTMQARNFFNYGQSQPAAITGGALDPVEPFEDPDPLVFGNSRTVILHAHGWLRVTLNND